MYDRAQPFPFDTAPDDEDKPRYTAPLFSDEWKRWHEVVEVWEKQSAENPRSTVEIPFVFLCVMVDTSPSHPAAFVLRS